MDLSTTEDSGCLQAVGNGIKFQLVQPSSESDSVGSSAVPVD